MHSASPFEAKPNCCPEIGTSNIWSNCWHNYLGQRINYLTGKDSEDFKCGGCGSLINASKIFIK